jgi:Predicted nucleotide-binding protein containing TIR-like domain
MKPRVFIGSSTEGLDVARAIELKLDPDCECVHWGSNVFEVSATFIESLEKTLDEVEFAVLVVTPDDLRVKRDETGKIPRDNVVFELGLFMGRLGRQRVFVVCDPKDVQLPTDLMGVSLAEYDSKRTDGNIVAAVSVAATKIVFAIRKAPRLAPSQPITSPGSILLDQDALFNAIVSWPTTNSEIIIHTLDTDWVWMIFPTLMHWRLNGVRVRVFAPPIRQEGSRREAIAQRALLRELGVDFRETQELSVSAFFLRTPYPEDDIVVVLNEGTGKDVPLAVRYAGKAHSSAIEALKKLLPELPMPPTSLYAPSLVPQEIAEVTDRLRVGVSQYRSPKVEMDLTTIRTSELLLMSPYARSYKYKQIDNLVDSYHAIEQQPFTALAVTLESGGRSVVTPPVVEERPEGPVVIEGTTRAAYCYQNNIDGYHCIRVRGVNQDLPGKPVEIKHVTIAERSLSQRQRTEEFNYSLFRSIEQAVHPY